MTTTTTNYNRPRSFSISDHIDCTISCIQAITSTLGHLVPAVAFVFEQHPNYTPEEKEAGIHERYLQNPGVKVLQLGKAS